jgi:thioredoxin-related protein
MQYKNMKVSYFEHAIQKHWSIAVIDFKKVVSVVVLFSFVLCSCGDKHKSILSRNTSTKNTPAEIKLLPCCHDDLITWGIKDQGQQCINPKEQKCRNNIGPPIDPKNRPCCFEGFGDINEESCVNPVKGSCYVDPLMYDLAAKKAILKDYFYYRHHPEIENIVKEVLNGKIKKDEVDEKVKAEVKKLKLPEKVEKVEIVGKENFEKEVLSSDMPVLVVFSKPTCSRCKELSPVVKELTAYEHGGKAKIRKVSEGEAQNKDLFSEYGIEGFPTLIWFKKGKDGKMVPKGKMIGYRSLSDLEWIINESLSEEKK